MWHFGKMSVKYFNISVVGFTNQVIVDIVFGLIPAVNFRSTISKKIFLNW